MRHSVSWGTHPICPVYVLWRYALLSSWALLPETSTQLRLDTGTRIVRHRDGRSFSSILGRGWLCVSFAKLSRTQDLNVTDEYDVIEGYCKDNMLQLAVTIGEWKTPARSAISIKNKPMFELEDKLVCNVYISSNKDGHDRWIMQDGNQARYWKPKLALIRNHLSKSAEVNWTTDEDPWRTHGDPWSTSSSSDDATGSHTRAR